MVYWSFGGGAYCAVPISNRGWLVRDDVMEPGYTINLEYLCRNQSFTPEQVVSSELVMPKGAVPNSMLLWIRIELIGGTRKFVTVSLVEFYKHVELPESSIGGWTSGDRGSDSAGLNSRYEANDTGSDESLSNELQLGAEGATKTVAARVPEEEKDRANT